MQYIPRDTYLAFLTRFPHTQLIKVISGVRRCGKSTLFAIFQDRLKKTGVTPQQIININFEELSFSDLTDHKRLYEYVLSQAQSDKMNYVFLDEIQHVPHFEKTVDSLFLHRNLDIYITGSNAYFMSGELATLLSGRYVELRMLPLSLKEFCTGNEHSERVSLQKKFTNYLTHSSFPYALQFKGRQQDINVYLSGIYNTILLKDVIARLNISDVMRLENIFRFLMDNTGNLISIKKIADAMTSMGRKSDSKTIEKYVQGLKDSLIIYEAPRYDVRGKALLATQAKYYAVDMGLRNWALGKRGSDLGHQLENVVYLELLRRGKKVYVGKLDDGEVDFVAFDNSGREYYQVAVTTLDDAVLQRELKPLRQIQDQYPKYLLTLDELEPEADFEGISKLNALQWMLDT